MEAKRVQNIYSGSAQKARLVVDMIRGKNVNEALAILQFTNKRAADRIEKCLRSAIANATETAEKANVAVDPDELWVKAAYVDMGPTKKRRRVRPAPQGRAYRERRHFCHVTVHLSSEGKDEAPRREGQGRRTASRAVDAAARRRRAAAKAREKARRADRRRSEDGQARAAEGALRKTEQENEPTRAEDDDGRRTNQRLRNS